MSRAAEYRDRAEQARRRAAFALSDEDRVLERKRQKTLNAVADIEEWLDHEVRVAERNEAA